MNHPEATLCRIVAFPHIDAERNLEIRGEPLAAGALLEQLGLPTDAPAQPRARDPSTLDGEDSTDDRDE